MKAKRPEKISRPDKPNINVPNGIWLPEAVELMGDWLFGNQGENSKEDREECIKLISDAVLKEQVRSFMFGPGGIQEEDATSYFRNLKSDIFDAGYANVYKKGASSIVGSTFSGNVRHSVFLQAAEFNNFLNSLYPDSPQKLNNAAENKAYRWLVKKMAGKSKRENTKTEYRNEAQTLFSGLGVRAFNRAWNTALKEAGNENWEKPGRARKKS